MRRREALGLLAAALPLAAARADEVGDIDVTGVSPPLSFTMRTTPDGRVATEADCKGVVTMLYFGYTFCPDVCPLTLQNVAAALAKTGGEAKQIRFLFVTVDPDRDTVPVLKDYTALFGPSFVGLRGDPDQLARLAKRFRIAWSVTPSPDPARYEVNHSAVIYVFDRQLNARMMVPAMDTANPDIGGLATDLVRLTREKPSWRDWLRAFV